MVDKLKASEPCKAADNSSHLKWALVVHLELGELLIKEEILGRGEAEAEEVGE